jgi:hypothetical protein
MTKWHAILLIIPLNLLVVFLASHGCVAQQADMRDIERRLMQSNQKLAQSGAQQRQELEALKGEEIPKLRGELDRALQKMLVLQSKQDDLEQQMAVLKQPAKSELDANLSTQMRESLNALDVKNKADRDQLRGDVNIRLDEINRQMEVLSKDIIDAVQKTNATLVKNVDGRLDALDVVVGKILLRLDNLEKQRKPIKNKK